MKTTIQKALFTFALMALPSLAAAANCPVDANDPFAEEQVMPGGMYKGHCIDSNKFRSSRRLSAEEIASFGLAPEENVEVVANFHHDEKYWVAVIPLERVQEVDFQFLPLFGNAPLFHGQLRFRLKPEGRPVRLYEQTKSADRKTITLNQDINFAEYGVRAADKAQKFSIVKGMVGGYAIAYTIGSISQDTMWEVKHHTEIRQYKLNLDEDSSRNALRNGITVGTQLKISRVYNTAVQSCINASFLVLDRTRNVPEHNMAVRFFESVSPVQALEAMKLIYRNGASRIENYDGSEWYQDDLEGLY